MAAASRLAGAASTYLAQHAGNPVDWWPWSDEAFDEARRRDVPVLLSVGYASCHWCHVMARESFSDHVTAEQLNRDFVAIKVDREERPDVDAVYMSATQALTGHGGWPMTCFLTPDGTPFYAGTYFPPVPTSGLPAFRQLLSAISQAWTTQREAVTEAAARIGASLAEMSGPLAGGRLGAAELAAAADDMLGQIDMIDGGFGGAPKFPPAMAAEFLLRHHERTGSPPARAAVTLTLDRMARGGIFDQLAGGFSRYSVDKTWHVPHFEKMLDDNAQLLRLYAHHARLTGSALSERVAAQTAQFLLRDLRLPSGGFAASLDADTGGVEGATYRWTRHELIDELGSRDGQAAADLFALPQAGPDGVAAEPADDLAAEVIRLPVDPADPGWFAGVRTRLLAARDRRPQPGRDDIVVLRSNGLAIAALAEAGAAAGHTEWVDAAVAAAEYLLGVHRMDGRWYRSSRDGRVGPGRAVLTDHADLAGGLLALYQATGVRRWLDEGIGVIDQGLAHFADRAAAAVVSDDRQHPLSDSSTGGFFDTADDAGPLIVRPRDPTDGAAPSGQSAITNALLTAAALTGNAAYRACAEASLASVAVLVARFPRSAGWHLCAAEVVASGPLQVVVAGDPGEARDALATVARRYAPAGSVIDIGMPDAPGRELLAARPAIGGAPTAYVCRGFVCDRPVTDPADLRALLITR
ncbi:MAG TPA: thioredoxin domain-containing protein [Nakamurella sp.]|nr:thioredoxin domain-containing protein [Nakamurella sp.]